MSARTLIWFDAASPPQVLWFSGLAPHLKDRGFDLLITARSHADTAALAKRFLPRLDQVVEGHDSGGSITKLGAIGRRALRLRDFVRRREPGRMVAISHNSYAQILAARSLRIPVLTSMDFEGQPANHLAFRLANRVLLPEAFPASAATRQGARPTKVIRYPGVKEAVYLADAVPEPHQGDDRLPTGRPLAVVRPEAGFATYQHAANPLFPLVIEHLLSKGAHVILLPRGEDQRRDLTERWLGQIEVPKEAVDGPSLLRRADLFVGGGGTMTREAAVLGTPAYSVYWGSTPAVDLYLENLGLLRILHDTTDVERIEVQRRTNEPSTMIGPETRDAVLAAIKRFVLAYR